MDIIAFHNAVCAGDLEKVKEGISCVSLNKNFVFLQKHESTVA